MKLSLVLTQDFVDDLSSAMRWYDEQQLGLGDRLYSEVTAELKRIEKAPASFGVLENNFRQAGLSTFPYVIVFKIFSKEVVAFALFHTAQNPDKKTSRRRR